MQRKREYIYIYIYGIITIFAEYGVIPKNSFQLSLQIFIGGKSRFPVLYKGNIIKICFFLSDIGM